MNPEGKTRIWLRRRRMEVRLKKEVLGVNFDDLTREEAAQAGAALLEEDKFHYVVTPNPEFILAAEKDRDFLQVLNGADLVLADGAKPGVAEEAGRRILERHPGITLCGTQDGYFQDEEAALLKVAAARPDLLFVCLGAPKQEKWMARWGKHTGARLAIGLGGALDVFAGKVERAPEAWQKLGLEWAYRLKKEPRRAGRMAKLPLVLVKAAGRRLKK